MAVCVVCGGLIDEEGCCCADAEAAETGHRLDYLQRATSANCKRSKQPQDLICKRSPTNQPSTQSPNDSSCNKLTNRRSSRDSPRGCVRERSVSSALTYHIINKREPESFLGVPGRAGRKTRVRRANAAHFVRTSTGRTPQAQQQEPTTGWMEGNKARQMDDVRQGTSRERENKARPEPATAGVVLLKGGQNPSSARVPNCPRQRCMPGTEGQRKQL
ncbi:hypothetical protein IWZ01DRAFT_22619 [Phyllosticta capitalensis]